MFPATLAALLLAAAPEPPTLYVEFDGKGGHNPSVPAAGTIAATGTFTLPPKAEFLAVELDVAPRHQTPKSIGRILKAEVDLTVKPHKWTARGDGFAPGIYLVAVKVTFDLADKDPVKDEGASFFAEGWELRRVEIVPAKK